MPFLATARHRYGSCRDANRIEQPERYPVDASLLAVISNILSAAFSGIGLLLATIGLTQAAAAIRVRRRHRPLRDGSGLDEKVRRVASMSRELIGLNSEIRDEFALRLAEVERLKREATTAQEIAGINAEAMKAAESLLAGVVNQNARGDRIFQVVVAVIGFAAGVGATFVIQAITGT
jgi:hypothetical protein